MKPKSLGVSTMPRAEVVVPDAVDDHAGEQRVVRGDVTHSASFLRRSASRGVRRQAEIGFGPPIAARPPGATTAPGCATSPRARTRVTPGPRGTFVYTFAPPPAVEGVEFRRELRALLAKSAARSVRFSAVSFASISASVTNVEPAANDAATCSGDNALS